MRLPAYETLFDGLRGYYASVASERSYAGFSAAMVLSFLLAVNLISVFTISTVLIDGNLHRVGWVARNKLFTLLVGVGVAAAHVQYAKSTGRYHSNEPARSPRWKRTLIIYVSLTIALLAGAILSAFASRLIA